MDDLLNAKLKKYISGLVNGKKDELIKKYNTRARKALEPLEKKMGLNPGTSLDKSLKDLNGYDKVLNSKNSQIEQKIKEAGSNKAATSVKKNVLKKLKF